jgi:hypothetical protein
MLLMSSNNILLVSVCPRGLTRAAKYDTLYITIYIYYILIYILYITNYIYITTSNIYTYIAIYC